MRTFAVCAKKFDQLNLDINSEKAVYSKRQKVDITLNARTRADEASEGHFSVSVIDESKVPVDENAENTILTNILLTSDIKGFVEQPGYYFNNISDKTTSDLDLVMLTHGYRRFQWKQVLNNTDTLAAFKPENALEITGKATNLAGKPLVKGLVSLIAKNGSFTTTTTDDKGVFRFTDLGFTDTARFILQAISAKGNNATKLTYDNVATEPAVLTADSQGNNETDKLMSAYMENGIKQLDNQASYGNLKSHVLKNVIIKSKKVDEPTTHQDLVSTKFADQLVTKEMLEQSGETSLSARLRGKLYGLAVSPFTGEVNAGLIVLDGTSMPSGFDINTINPSDVESVAAYTFAGAEGIYGVRGGHGVLSITTRKGSGLDLKDITSTGILPISPKGYYKAREFYSPKYDVVPDTNSRTDFRTTIYWQPELNTNSNGTASFSFYNADSPGIYRVVIEGVDNKGNIGRQVYRYKVK